MNHESRRIPRATLGRRLRARRSRLLLGAVLVPLMLPVPAFAVVCPTATMDQILALGHCTIGDATFGFTNQHLPPNPVYFNGPFAGDTGLGPAAAALTFTPDASLDHPGFALTGNFRAFGEAFRFNSFSQSLKTGNFYDEVLSYLEVTPGSGKGLSGYSITLGDAQVSQGHIGSIAKADLNNAVAVINDDGFTRLTDSASFGALVLGTQLFDSNIQTYERSNNPADVAGFGSISYGFVEQSIAPAVPEPESYALMLAGLAAVGAFARRRRGA